MANGPLTVLVLVALIRVIQLTPVELQTSGCDVDGQRYSVGQRWNIGCNLSCSCQAENSWGCGPRCTLRLVKSPCRLVPNPNRDAVNGENCCDVEECPGGCSVDGIQHRAGDTWNVGCDRECFCIGNGNYVCWPKCGLAAAPPPCRMFPNPDRDEENGQNCCDLIECPEGFGF